MAIQYEIEDGVLMLRLAAEGFSHLRSALRAAAGDAAARPTMPLLLDLRGEPPTARYEDIRWRTEILAEMREQFGPRWAFLIDPDPARNGIGQMFAVFSRVHGLDVGLFTDKRSAFRWLWEAEMLKDDPPPGSRVRILVSGRRATIVRRVTVRMHVADDPEDEFEVEFPSGEKVTLRRKEIGETRREPGVAAEHGRRPVMEDEETLRPTVVPLSG
jgi:hypothetical protein